MCAGGAAGPVLPQPGRRRPHPPDVRGGHRCGPPRRRCPPEGRGHPLRLPVCGHRGHEPAGDGVIYENSVGAGIGHSSLSPEAPLLGRIADVSQNMAQPGSWSSCWSSCPGLSAGRMTAMPSRSICRRRTTTSTPPPCGTRFSAATRAGFAVPATRPRSAGGTGAETRGRSARTP